MEMPRWTEHPYKEDYVRTAYVAAPPIIQAAVDALLTFEERVDPIGYDIAYYQDDLLEVVAEAIAPWAAL